MPFSLLSRVRWTLPGLALLVGGSPCPAAEFHVAPTGGDRNPGGADSPLRTIQRAAELAQPGDTITVHAGVYRERVNPPRGGNDEGSRIVYQAAPGEVVDVRGSEVATGWERVGNDTWKVVLPAGWFTGFNPYADVIRGDWFDPRGREHHTGAVYLDGVWLTEAARLEDVLRPVGEVSLWFGKVDGGGTTLWAQFPGANPNERLVEVNVRRTVFYPDQPGRNFITVRGFRLRHAATPWAPPTAEQVGLIGTHWSRGWVIEGNEVSHSTCSGIALGKHGDAFDNTSADTAEGYVKTIERAYARGWTRETIGHHVVRNNTVSHCEQAGIVGSLGAAFSVIEGNDVHDIHVRRLFSGAEMAGIKIHAAIDATIRGNHLHRTIRGLWLDWMAQGTRVTGNVFQDNLAEDLFVEVNHGPFLVDHNCFLSATSLLDMSEGGAYAHNLFAGRLVSRPEPGRQTPYHPAHSTATAGLVNVRGGDDRFLNNLFVGRGAASVTAGNDAGHGLWVYDRRELPVQTGGNVYLNGAKPYAREGGARVLPGFQPGVVSEGMPNGVRVRYRVPPAVDGEPGGARVTSQRLGRALVSGQAYEAPDGGALVLDRDANGALHDAQRPMPGPAEGLVAGMAEVTLRAGPR